MRIIYSKMDSNKCQLYQAITNIVEQNNKRYIKKQAVYPEGVAHVRSLYDKYRTLKDLFQTVKVAECKLDGDTIVFEYINGEPIINEINNIVALNDRSLFEEFLKKYLEIIKISDKNLTVFERSNEFTARFGDTEIPENTVALKISNVDLIDKNILIKDGLYYIIDYEFVYDYPVPLDFVIYRNLTILYHDNKNLHNFISFEQLLEICGVTMDIELLRELFFIHESGFFLDIKTGVSFLEVQKKQLKYSTHLQDLNQDNTLVSTVFYDVGDGFKPEQSTTLSVQRDSNGEFICNFDISHVHNLVSLRFDPCQFPCEMEAIEISMDQQPVDYLYTNANKQDKDIFYYEHNDPMFIFELSNFSHLRPIKTFTFKGICKRFSEDQLVYALTQKTDRLTKTIEQRNEIEEQFRLEKKDWEELHSLLCSEKQILETEKQNLETEKQNLEGKYNSLINSSSWKITKPIRKIMDLLKKKINSKVYKNKVSVIMPCYNDGDYIEESIASIFNQTHQDIELIIINDGSDDPKTLQILNTINDPRMTILQTNRIRPAAARNYAIQQAHGEYILPVDSDDTIDPTYVEKAIQILQQNKKIGVVYCKADLFGEQTGPWSLPDYSLDRMLLDNIVFVTAMFYKKDFIKIGGFNTKSYKHGMEDYDFWISMLEHGREIYQIPEVLFHYRIKTVSRTTEFQKNAATVQQVYEHIYNNHPKFYKKHKDKYAKTLRKELIAQLFKGREQTDLVDKINQEIKNNNQRIRKMQNISYKTNDQNQVFFHSPVSMIITTSICANYLPKAAVLARSIKEHISGAVFVVSLVENEVPEYASNNPDFDFVVLAKDIGFENFNRFIFKHSIVEASTAVKGQLFRHLYKMFPQQTSFVYLDPDIKVYSDFVELKELLKTRPIVLCPHLLEPGNIDMELSSTAHGVYNLGFLAVNRSLEAQNFIDWWAERLFLFCYDDIQRGIFTDQKWIDLAPCFFDVQVLKHKGYDFATWSLLKSDVNVRDGKIFIADDQLRFIHFSGFDSGTIDWAIKEWLSDQPDSPFIQLYKEYSDEMEQAGQSNIGKTPWFYNYYKCLDLVDKKVREEYRKNHEVPYSIQDPFEQNNAYFYEALGMHLPVAETAPSSPASPPQPLLKRGARVFRDEGIFTFSKKVAKKVIKKVIG